MGQCWRTTGDLGLERGAGGLPGPAPRSAHALVSTASGGLLVVGGVQDGALADASPMVLDNAAAVEGRTLRNQAAAALAARFARGHRR